MTTPWDSSTWEPEDLTDYQSLMIHPAEEVYYQLLLDMEKVDTRHREVYLQVTNHVLKAFREMLLARKA